MPPGVWVPALVAVLSALFVFVNSRRSVKVTEFDAIMTRLNEENARLRADLTTTRTDLATALARIAVLEGRTTP